MDRDVIVVGGGPVGLALARALADRGVALIAAGRPAAALAGEGFDARVYALSPGNAAFLESLGAWRDADATAVHAMQVFGDRGARVEFDAYRAGLPALAWVVEDRKLQQALWEGLGVEVVAPARPQALQVQADRALLALHDDRKLAARLVVGADGATSFVRAQAAIPVADNPYGQKAVVANFACERPHRGTAYQWFAGAAVLALLPLAGNHVSMVWSLADFAAERIEGLSDTALSSEVEAASRGVLGALRLVTPPRSYPLRRLSARRMVAPRIALAGDAAHVIHPLAGQGLNLGLQDARALAHALASREGLRDAGDLRVLRRYERARAEPILAMDTMVHGLYRLFGAQGGIAAATRNAGLNLTDRLPVVKNLLIRHAAS